jgi:hypothetical protein
MECSICFSDISKGTGLATLSCAHTFHLGCIGRWILKNESCPLCRHDLVEHERIAEDDPDATEVDEDEWVDDEEEDDESVEMPNLRWRRVGVGRWVVEDEEDDEAPDLPEFEPENLALWNMRDLFGPLNDLEVPEVEAAHEAAIKIQSLMRGAIARHNVRDATLMLRLRQNRAVLNHAADERGYESA